MHKNNVRNFTKHTVKLFYTQGCGTYLTVDGVEYNHLRKDGSYEGISNKQCYEILRKFDNEITETLKLKGYL